MVLHGGSSGRKDREVLLITAVISDQEEITKVKTNASSRLPQQVAGVVDLDEWRARAAWELAARHLNEQGVAAAVPVGLVSYLKRRGLEVWAAGRSAA